MSGPPYLALPDDRIAFVLVVLALAQWAAAWRDRDPALRWAGLAALASAALALLADRGLPEGVLLAALCAVRGAAAAALLPSLGVPPAAVRRTWGVLALPALAVAGWALPRGAGAGALTLAFLLATDGAAAAVCVWAARREPGAGHSLLALGVLAGAASLAWALALGPQAGAPWRSTYAWPQAAAFGVALLVAGRLRHGRASRQAQAQAQRMSNYYAALSQTNQVLLRLQEAEKLYAEICRICVEAGHARMACVYLDGGDVALRVATAGPAAEFLASVPPRWDITTPEARASLTVQALREGRRLVANDYPAELRGSPWREEALRHGVHAIAWLPLRRSGRVAGVLMLAAGEKGFFDESLLQLLDEMTGDISFALSQIDREEERRAAQREVQAGLERFTRLFEAAPVAAAIVSLDEHRVLDVNAAMCRRFGLAREALVGHVTSALGRGVVPDDRARFYEQLKRDGEVRNLVLQMADESGATHPELVNAAYIDYRGQPCFLVMQHDISELQAAAQARQALAAAEAASRAKTEFLSRMSHELRTPLNAVLGFSTLVRDGARERLSAVERAQLDHVQQAGWHLLTLIDDVLDISRIEAGQFGVEVRCVHVQPLLDEVRLLSQPLAGRYGVLLRPAAVPGVPLGAVADATRLRQVLLNLLSNAVKYNRPGGWAGVRARCEGQRVFIVVEDAGLGMTPEQQAHLFEPFNRLGREREGIEGSGIGLALARQLVLLMGGELHVDSEAGRGTRVTLALAACDVAPAAPPQAAAPVAAEPRGTVLYIEDNAVNALLVEQLLSRWAQVKVVLAADGQAGLALARSTAPDLVLLDLQLPDIDGLDLLGLLRAEPALQGVPVVVLTADAMPADVARARAAGATDYWTKPLDFQRALADIAELLHARRR